MEFRKFIRVLKTASSKHKNDGNGASQHSTKQSDISEHASGYAENLWQAPMHKGRTQRGRASRFWAGVWTAELLRSLSAWIINQSYAFSWKKSSRTKPQPRAKQSGKWRHPFIHSSGFVCPRSVVLHLERNSPTHQHRLGLTGCKAALHSRTLRFCLDTWLQISQQQRPTTSWAMLIT